MPTSTDERIAFKVRTVAHQLEVTEQHVRNLITRGELRSVKLGRVRRVLAADLAAYLQRVAS